MDEARYSLSLRNSPDYDSGILTIRGETWGEFCASVEETVRATYPEADWKGLLGSFFQLNSKEAQEFVRTWNDVSRQDAEAKADGVKESALEKAKRLATETARKGAG